MTKTKAVAVKQEAAVQTVAEAQGLAAVTEEHKVSGSFDSSDIILPKILLMQSISQLVEAEKFRAGDFVHSLDETLIGKKEEKPIEFIALGRFETLQTYEDNKYVKTESVTYENKRLPYEETVSGVKVNRNLTNNYYVLRVEDFESMTVFPMVITFKRTSFKAGKKLNTKITMLEDFGAACYAKTFKLVAKSEEGDKGKYYVLDILDGRKCNDVEVKQSVRWADRLKATNVVVHEEDEDGATKDAAAPVQGSSDINF